MLATLAKVNPVGPGTLATITDSHAVTWLVKLDFTGRTSNFQRVFGVRLEMVCVIADDPVPVMFDQPDQPDVEVAQESAELTWRTWKLSTVTPLAYALMPMSTLPGSEPAETVMLGVGISIFVVTDTAAVSPQLASSKLILTWNSYSVAAVRPVSAICVSL